MGNDSAEFDYQEKIEKIKSWQMTQSNETPTYEYDKYIKLEDGTT